MLWTEVPDVLADLGSEVRSGGLVRKVRRRGEVRLGRRERRGSERRGMLNRWWCWVWMD